jgi:hypothetical protein
VTADERRQSGDRMAAVLVWLLLGASLVIGVLAVIAAVDSRPPSTCAVIAGQTLERTSTGTTESTFPTSEVCK